MLKLLLVHHRLSFGLPLRHACGQLRLQDFTSGCSTLQEIPGNTHLDKSILNLGAILTFPHRLNLVCTDISKAPGKTIPITASYPAV
jgi:hypothetical protein